jgi:hypothetical protein
MDALTRLPPGVTLVLALMLLVWLVLLLLVPFMIESIRGWSRKTYLELEAMNKKLDRLIALLAERETAARVVEVAEPGLEARPAREARTDRRRKEPTISG